MHDQAKSWCTVADAELSQELSLFCMTGFPLCTTAAGFAAATSKTSVTFLWVVVEVRPQLNSSHAAIQSVSLLWLARAPVLLPGQDRMTHTMKTKMMMAKIQVIQTCRQGGT